MQLLYITHHSVFHLHVVPTSVSVLLVVGALYGAVRLAIDFNSWVRRTAPEKPPQL